MERGALFPQDSDGSLKATLLRARNISYRKGRVIWREKPMVQREKPKAKEKYSL